MLLRCCSSVVESAIRKRLIIACADDELSKLLVTGFAILGASLAAPGFLCCNIYSAELFPTPVRQEISSCENRIAFLAQVTE